MWSRWYLGSNSAVHGMMVLQRGRLRCLSISRGSALYASFLRRCDHRVRPALIAGMVKKPTDVVNEKGIELIGNLLLVGEVQCSVEGNPRYRCQRRWESCKDIDLPDTLEMHWTDFHDLSHFLAFENAIPSPSSHAGDIEELCAVYHMVVWEDKNVNIRSLPPPLVN